MSARALAFSWARTLHASDYQTSDCMQTRQKKITWLSVCSSCLQQVHSGFAADVMFGCRRLASSHKLSNLTKSEWLFADKAEFPRPFGTVSEVLSNNSLSSAGLGAVYRLRRRPFFLIVGADEAGEKGSSGRICNQVTNPDVHFQGNNAKFELRCCGS